METVLQASVKPEKGSAVKVPGMASLGRPTPTSIVAFWELHNGGGRGVSGLSEAPGGIGVWGKGAGLAGKFEGDVEVTGNINGQETSTITCFDVNLTGADCAEEFDLAEREGVSPGTVLVIT
jgi:hypothetical protein